MFRTALKHSVDKQLLLNMVPLFADTHVINVPAVRLQDVTNHSVKVIVADGIVIADKGRIIVENNLSIREIFVIFTEIFNKLRKFALILYV